MTRSRRKHSQAAGALVARAATATESPVSSGSSDSDSRPRHRACVDETQTTLLALPGAPVATTDAEESAQYLHGAASNHISASADTTDDIRALSALVEEFRRQVGRLEKELVDARAQPQIAPAPVGAPQTADVDFEALRATVEAQQKQIAALLGMLETSVTSVSHLVSRVPGAPMQTQMPHARAPAKAAQPARPAAAAAAPVAMAAGAPAWGRPAAAGAARATPASVRAPRGLPAVAAAAQQRHSFVAALSMEDATGFAAGSKTEGTLEVRVAKRIATFAASGYSLPHLLARSVVRSLRYLSGRTGPDCGVVSASFLNAKAAAGGIGVEPQRGDLLRVLFTVTSDAVADTVVRYRHRLRQSGIGVFDVLSDTEEAQHRALWPAFLAAKVAGKRAQFHRARLMIDGERVPPPARKSDN
jgi:hypothetical protein